MRHFDRITGFLISDDEKRPLSGNLPPEKDILDNLDKYILSVAGWRAVFACSGLEEDNTPSVKDADLLTASAAAYAFYSYLGKSGARILLGCDARPTGRVLSEIALRTFLSLGADVDFIYISSAPEVMAFSNDGYDGFYYISASHNPIGHNGFKFGKAGGVFAKDDNDAVIALFKDFLSSDDFINRASGLIDCPVDKLRSVLLNHDDVKAKSLSYYEEFVLRTAYADSSFQIPFGIVAELNGSARSASIDIPYLNKRGAKVWAVNASAGQVDHAIVPEGKNLELCRTTLERVHGRDNAFILGYVPDNDGDRGNFVYLDEYDNSAKILHAQEVFALIALIEVAHQALRGEEKIAIAVNGPTSARVDDAVALFGAEVFRADVGEANVVALASILRDKGYSVHLCGEGSNGGIITDPAKVRDPMNSIMSIAKLYSVDGLYSLIADKLSIEDKEKVSLSAIIKAIPQYASTSMFEKEAVLKVRSREFEPLKREYEELFEEAFPLIKSDILDSYEVHQFELTEDRVGIGPDVREKNSAGGYQIRFYDKNGASSAYLWLSKSKTEPVMRIMADVKGGDKTLYDQLFSLQRKLVEEADEIANE